jgi:hypothetical protein
MWTIFDHGWERVEFSTPVNFKLCLITFIVYVYFQLVYSRPIKTDIDFEL